MEKHFCIAAAYQNIFQDYYSSFEFGCDHESKSEEGGGEGKSVKNVEQQFVRLNFFIRGINWMKRILNYSAHSKSILME